MPRLFIAIDLPTALKHQLEALKTDIPGAVWVKRSSFHLTLRFLGNDIDPIRIAPITRALEQVRAASFRLALRSVGRFPHSDNKAARVLWIGIEQSSGLEMLQAEVEKALAAIDFPPQDRPFNPHITLARLKSEKRLLEIADFLKVHQAFAPAPFVVQTFHLYESKLTPQGAQYTQRATFMLAEPDS
jgi:2'-5' RNA ligase